MAASDVLEQGRAAFARRAWGDAYTQLSAADREAPLAFEDLERLAAAAYLTGRDEDSVAVWTRAHHECLRLGDPVRAARCAFWLTFELLNKGEMAPAGGWLARAQRLIEEAGRDCVERGYLLVPFGVRCCLEGDPTTGYAAFADAASIGERLRDLDLIAMARHGEGQALMMQGETARGMAVFDEAMVAVMAGEVSPLVAGAVYCGVIEACQAIFDLRRAQEWTEALSRWCASQPDLAPYQGQCLVYRAEILQWHGAWPDAIDEARRACERLSGQPAAGMAFYQVAELYRLRGEFARAEEAYRQASRFGREPQPGLALLRLAQGEVDAAATAVRRALDEAHDPLTRSRLLAAAVEIMLAARDVHAARTAADELAEIAARLAAPLLQAVSAYATGAVLLAEGDARAALTALRWAWVRWQELEAPYEAARVRVLLGHACRALGDEDGASLELGAARSMFRELGAVSDLARVEALSASNAAAAVGGLTAREVEVLRLLATGKTNRAIAADLILSERTVDRHVSNIFTKLGVSTRSAATAYAVAHGIA